MKNEQWLKEDKICYSCGQVTKKQKGLTKQNIKRLFSIKFDMNELIMTVIIILVIFSAFSYKSETQVCRDYIENNEKDIDTSGIPNFCNKPGGCEFNLTTNTIDSNG